MKTISIQIVLVLITILGISQEYEWPIVNQTPGENILYKPQDIIDREPNLDRLIISANEGDSVVAPIDGLVEHFSYKYYLSLNSDMSTADISDADELTRKNFASHDNTGKIDPHYVTASITITAATSHRITIEGFRSTPGKRHLHWHGFRN